VPIKAVISRNSTANRILTDFSHDFRSLRKSLLSVDLSRFRVRVTKHDLRSFNAVLLAD